MHTFRSAGTTSAPQETQIDLAQPSPRNSYYYIDLLYNNIFQLRKKVELIHHAAN